MRVQMFLSTRRVRLLEDLLLLSASLGEKDGDGAAAQTGAAAAAAAAPHPGGTGPQSSVAELRRELAIALKAIDATTSTTSTTKSHFEDSTAAGGGGGGGGGQVIFFREGGATAEGLRAASGVSTEAFFEAWAERFGTLVVPLAAGGDGVGDKGGGGDGGGGRGAAPRKDDRLVFRA